MRQRMFDRELKKGSAELLILSLVEAQPRHGYELSKLIEARSEGLLSFRVASLASNARLFITTTAFKVMRRSGSSAANTAHSRTSG